MSKKFDRDALLALPHKDVKARYEALFGEAPRSPNKTWMVNQMHEEHERRKAARKAEKAEVEAPAATRGARRPVAAEPEEPDREVETDVAETESAHLAEDEPVAPPAPEPPNSRMGERGATRDEEAADVEEPATLPEPAEEDASASSPSTDGDEAEPSEATEESIAAAATGDGLSSSPFERGRFRSMTIEELRTRYEQVLGRATTSVDRNYLTWKITRAEKGRIRVGPVVAGRRLEGSLAGADKTLPLTLTAMAVVAMDAAWRRLGFTSRMKFMRAAIRQELERGGEADAADLFGEKGAA